MEWTSNFAIGIKEIDELHERLFIYINDVKLALKTERKRQLLLTIFPKLINDTKRYLEYEEQYMLYVRYPHVTFQKRQHEIIIKRISDLYQNLQDGKVLVGLELYSLLNQWYLTHILFEDKKLGEFYAELMENIAETTVEV